MEGLKLGFSMLCLLLSCSQQVSEEAANRSTCPLSEAANSERLEADWTDGFIRGRTLPGEFVWTLGRTPAGQFTFEIAGTTFLMVRSSSGKWWELKRAAESTEVYGTYTYFEQCENHGRKIEVRWKGHTESFREVAAIM